MSPAAKRRRLLVLAAALVVFGLALFSGRGNRPRPAATPAEAVTNALYDGLIASVRKGDVRGYLACFDEPLRSTLRTTADAQGWRAFGAQLRAYLGRTTGVAVSKPEVADDEAAARLQWVYQADSDVQLVRLRRSGGVWLITSLEAVQRARLTIPYGTEVIPGLPPAGAGNTNGQ